MPNIDYVVADVFTDRAFAGNPLAVVLDATGLDGTTMQALAREAYLSETVSCCRRSGSFGSGAGPFHIVLDEGIGPVPVTVSLPPAQAPSATLSSPALPRKGPGNGLLTYSSRRMVRIAGGSSRGSKWVAQVLSCSRLIGWGARWPRFGLADRRWSWRPGSSIWIDCLDARFCA